MNESSKVRKVQTNIGSNCETFSVGQFLFLASNSPLRTDSITEWTAPIETFVVMDTLLRVRQSSFPSLLPFAA